MIRKNQHHPIFLYGNCLHSFLSVHLSILSLSTKTDDRFQYFGFNAWGGPVAQIALLKDHLVDKEKWISVRRFNRIYAVYQILPGPEAAELCCYFGYIARGRIGSIVGGMGFVLPGFVLMLLLSYVYTLIGLDNVYFVATFKALQPVVAAFVFRAVHKVICFENGMASADEYHRLNWSVFADSRSCPNRSHHRKLQSLPLHPGDPLGV